MKNKYTLSSSIVIIFHVVGLIGFSIAGLSDLFSKLVPFHLLLMLGLIIVTGYSDRRFIALMMMLIGLGFIVEVIGVNTGMVFGDYAYGRTLGIKLFNTPLMIGVNWFLLVYSTGVLLSALGLRNKLAISVAGAIIITSLDVLIEPVAMRFDYWSWAGDTVPIQNYIAWFAIAAFLFLINAYSSVPQNNKTAIVFICVQFGFFLGLNLWAL